MFKFILSKVAQSDVSEKVSEVVTEVSTTLSDGIQINPTTENMETAGLWFVTGMIGVFAVIGVVILSVVLLNKVGNKKEK